MKMKPNRKGRLFSPVIAAADRNETSPSGKSTVKSRKFKTGLKSPKLFKILQNNSPGFKAKKIFFENYMKREGILTLTTGQLAILVPRIDT